MTSANGTTPHIDGTQLAAARKRTFTAAKRALAALEKTAAQDMTELGNGDVPPAAALRKAAEKYFRLLDALDIMDTLLTPEALEAVHAGHEPGPVLDYPGWRDDLGQLTAVIAGVVPPGTPVTGDTPIGRLNGALYPGGLPELAPSQLAGPDPGYPPQGS